MTLSKNLAYFTLPINKIFDEGVKEKMKKFLVGFLMFFVFAVTVPMAVDAQTCRGKKYRKAYSGKRYNARNRSYRQYSSPYYATRGYAYEQRRPNFYRRHRNLINLGIATGAGALVGALVGGKKGALIGTAIGAGSGALYTYGLNPKKRRYYRR